MNEILLKNTCFFFTYGSFTENVTQEIKSSLALQGLHVYIAAIEAYLSVRNHVRIRFSTSHIETLLNLKTCL